jgi:hypothetical protein
MIQKKKFHWLSKYRSSFILIVVICTGRVSISSSIQVEGSDSGMEQTNGYEGLAALFSDSH